MNLTKLFLFLTSILKVIIIKFKNKFIKKRKNFLLFLKRINFNWS
jgi:hypothetical protein